MSISKEPDDAAQLVARKSWPRRHKVLTGLGVFFLIGIIGNLAKRCGSPEAQADAGRDQHAECYPDGYSNDS